MLINLQRPFSINPTWAQAIRILVNVNASSWILFLSISPNILSDVLQAHESHRSNKQSFLSQFVDMFPHFA